MEVWTKEQRDLYDWRYRTRISLTMIMYPDRIERHVNYAVGDGWCSACTSMLVTPRGPHD